MLMHNPPHPGEVLRELCLEPLGLSVTEAAKALGVSRKMLSAVLNGKLGISPEMAIRLSIPRQKAGFISRSSTTSGMQRNIARSSRLRSLSLPEAAHNQIA